MSLVPLRQAASLVLSTLLCASTLAQQPQLSATAPNAIVSAGDVIRLIRVADYDSVVREPLAFPVQLIHDADLLAGRVLVVTAGLAGLADNTYRVHVVDGADAGRTLVGSVEIVTPVAEVRRVGTKPPPVPADIESLIRGAATAK